MTLFSDVFANQIVFFSQIAILLIVGFFLIHELLLSLRRKASFASFPQNVSAYSVPELGITQFLLSLLIIGQFVFMGLALVSGAYLFGIVYLTNLSILTIVWMFSMVSYATNRDLNVFSKDFKQIQDLFAMIPNHKERIASFNQHYDYFKIQVDQRHKEFSQYVGGNTFNISYGKLLEIKDLVNQFNKNDLSKQIEALKAEFEASLIEYIKTNRKKPLNKVIDSIPIETSLNEILKNVEKYLSEDTKEVSEQMFQDFSKHNESTIIQIIDIASKYRFSVTTKQIDLILERVKVLPSKSELLNRLYMSNAITAPMIINYLEQDQDWIITPQMYEILQSGELSNVLSLLVDKNLIQSTRKFLQQLPVLKLQILYRVTGEIKNQTSELILEFRSFLPLRFLFSDPSTMYFNMYNSLVQSGFLNEFNNQLPLNEQIINNKSLITELYQQQYEASSVLRQRFESVKLNLLSSNLRHSSLIKLETAMELFYQYVVNLKEQEATVLFDFLEVVFLLEETDPLKVEEYMANKGIPIDGSLSLMKHRESGKTGLKKIINKERVLIKQLISRIERARLSYDRLLEMVK